MRQNYFTRFAQQLLAMHSQDAYSIESSDVDDWLADVPQHAPEDAMVAWTELLCLATARGTRESMDNSQLIDSLGGYFDRLLIFSGSDLADITTLPTFASLMRLIDNASLLRGGRSYECLGRVWLVPHAFNGAY